MSSFTSKWLLTIPVTLTVTGMAVVAYLWMTTASQHQTIQWSAPSVAGPIAPGKTPRLPPSKRQDADARDNDPTNNESTIKPDSNLTLEEFSRLISELTPSGQGDHRDLYLSLRDPISFIDELIRLRYEVEQGVRKNNHPIANGGQAAYAPSTISVVSSGITESSLDEQFPALPAEITLHIDPGADAVHGHHVLRWVNSETAQVEHMSRIHFLGGSKEQLIIDTGPLGGETGAWHLELYQAGDGLPRISRIPITVGPSHQATKREHSH